MREFIRVDSSEFQKRKSQVFSWFVKGKNFFLTHSCSLKVSKLRTEQRCNKNSTSQFEDNIDKRTYTFRLSFHFRPFITKNKKRNLPIKTFQRLTIYQGHHVFSFCLIDAPSCEFVALDWKQIVLFIVSSLFLTGNNLIGSGR